MSALTVILIAAAAMVALGVLAVAAWLFYTAYLTRLERRLAVRKGVYRDMVAGLAATERELLQPAILRADTLYDLEALEAVLEEQARSSTTRPAWLLEAYDRLGLVDKYIDRLQHARQWRDRAFAAELLGRVGNAKAVPVLLDTVQATRTEDADVREIALRALARIADPRAVGPLLQALRTSEVWLAPRIADILSRHGDLVVDPLIEVLQQPGRQPARAWAANVLGDVRAARAFPVLVRSLGDLEDEVRGKAASALGRLGDRRAVPYLLEHLLSDPAPFVRARIAGALGQFGDADVIDRLVRALGDPAWWVRMRSVEALEQIGEVAEGPLLVALDDADPEIRSRAAVALERLGVPARLVGMIERGERADEAGSLLVKFAIAGAHELLAELLLHPSPRVRLATVIAIRRAGRRDLAAELTGTATGDADGAIRAEAFEALRVLGLREAVPAALTGMVDASEPARTAAIRLIGELGGTESIPGLRARTSDPEPAVRAAAARALGLLRASTAAPDFRRLLPDPSPDVRQAAATAIGEAGARQLGDDLVPLLDDGEPRVRTAAATALGRVGNVGAVPAMVRAFREADPALREAIAGSVAQLKPSEVRALLDILVAGHDSPSRIALIRTLLQLRVEAPLPLIGPLAGDPDPAVRREAVAALGSLGSGAAPLAITALDDPDDAVRASAVDATLRLGLADQGGKLVRLLQHDPSPRVRERAALAIGLLEVPGGDTALLMAGRGTDQPPEVRAAAALSLGAFDGGSMVGEIAAMADEGPVRALIQSRLHDDAEYRLLARRLRHSRSLELRALSASTREGVEEELAEGMRSTLDAPERVRLVAGLKAFQGDRSRNALLGVLRGDPSAEVRAAALAAVTPMLSGDDLLAAARLAVADPSLMVRQQGIALLDRADASETMPAMLRALRADEDSSVLQEIATRAEASFDTFAGAARDLMGSDRHAVVLARVMASIHHPDLTHLLPPLGRSPSPVARGALAELWIARPDLVDGDLLEALARDPVTAVRRQAARAAASAGRHDIIASMVADPDTDTRRGLALLLATAPSADALDELRADAEPRVRAAAAVARLLRGDADTLPADIRRAEAAEAVMDAAPLAELRETARSSTDERRRLAAGLALAIVGDPVASEVVRSDPMPYVRGRVAAMLDWGNGG
ncbi:MAG: HEAT repeat domain-containing protein [Bacillota bacterium]